MPCRERPPRRRAQRHGNSSLSRRSAARLEGLFELPRPGARLQSSCRPEVQPLSDAGAIADMKVRLAMTGKIGWYLSVAAICLAPIAATAGEAGAADGQPDISLEGQGAGRAA